MEFVELNNSKYGFARGYKDNQTYRESFNKLTQTVFGFNLEGWYQDGNWADYYIPYSLFLGDEVISNVSVNRLEFLIKGEKKVGLQIGTVMTHEQHRNKGLNKYLLDLILNEWYDRVDFIYLFANDSVLDFYPKFDFVRMKEFQFSKLVKSNSSQVPRKLNVEVEEDLAILKRAITESIPISQIAALNRLSPIMFYCLSFKRDHLYYLEELNAVVIASFEGGVLFVDDLFTPSPLQLQSVIDQLASDSTRKVILGFTPLDESGFDCRHLSGSDTLFVLKDQESFFQEKKWMFPILSHA